MKIALACPASLPATQFGGILFLAVDIAKNLSNSGHDITIYTTDLDFANNPKTFNKLLPRIEQVDNFKICRSHTWLSIRLFYINPGMYRQLKKDDPDLIHIIGVRSFQALIATLISIRKKIPLVVSDQGGLTTHPDLQTSNFLHRVLFKIQMPLIQFIINHASLVIAANEYEKKIFEEFCDASKIIVIRNGIDRNIMNSSGINFKEKYKITEDFILFLGRFHKVKGIDILLQATSMIKDDLLNLHTKLVIMGVDFGFESDMLHMIDDLQISEIVYVIKNPPRQDVLSAYNESKFLVLPSRWELSPLTPLEGFAFKKTVISTTSHGIPYTIDNGMNSVLVPPEDPKSLANAILTLLKNPQKCLEYGKNGYDLVQKICNSNEMTNHILSAYTKILNQKQTNN
jgi:glycosyltransferase involved in cell wall biosynthesis